MQAGPVRLTIDHEVADGITAVVIDGPAPFALAYAPMARLALERLVRSGRLTTSDRDLKRRGIVACPVDLEVRTIGAGAEPLPQDGLAWQDVDDGEGLT